MIIYYIDYGIYEKHIHNSYSHQIILHQKKFMKHFHIFHNTMKIFCYVCLGQYLVIQGSETVE